MRRDRIFYFRKRLPKKISNQVPNQFLCLPLQTDLPLDAVKRAAALLTVLEQMEKIHVEALIKDSRTPETAKAVLTEMLRSALEVMLQEQNQDSALSAGEVDQRIEALQEENRRLRQAARNRQWTDVEPLLRAAGDRVALNRPTPISNDLGKRATALQRRLNDAEVAAQEGDDVHYAGSELLAEHGWMTSTSSFRHRFSFPGHAQEPRKLSHQGHEGNNSFRFSFCLSFSLRRLMSGRD
ncbi:hypothetical protein [Ruegeria atlantica]|uniref:hypothetical protein n=1 Tax=Ruegeria atlantica TaxID=81569 RepID=UPI002493F25F|nr:hypothetical protein [Ruegeria atlantica]